MRAVLLPLVVVLALALVPSAAAHGGCPPGEVVTIDVTGATFYVFTDEGTAPSIFVESNGRAGLQCDGEDPDMRLI